MSKQPPERIADLSNYLRKLGTDVAAQGKVAKIEGNPVQVAAVAILSGGIGMFEAMISDVKFLAGNGMQLGKAMAKPALAHGVGLLIEKLFPTR